MAYLAATVEDAVADRLVGPPNEIDTAAQAARFHGRDLEDVLAV